MKGAQGSNEMGPPPEKCPPPRGRLGCWESKRSDADQASDVGGGGRDPPPAGYDMVLGDAAPPPPAGRLSESQARSPVP